MKRFEEGQERDPDDHIVPSDVMDTYYRTDDLEPFAEKRKIPDELIPADIIIVDNNPGRFEEMREEHEKIVE